MTRYSCIAAVCSLLSRCRAPALPGGPSSGRDAGDYCRGSLLLSAYVGGCVSPRCSVGTDMSTLTPQYQ
eukprot:scaffold1503_cov120-Isochrysis_galbana.AAC.8